MSAETLQLTVALVTAIGVAIVAVLNSKGLLSLVDAARARVAHGETIDAIARDVAAVKRDVATVRESLAPLHDRVVRLEVREDSKRFDIVPGPER